MKVKLTRARRLWSRRGERRGEGWERLSGSLTGNAEAGAKFGVWSARGGELLVNRTANRRRCTL